MRYVYSFGSIIQPSDVDHYLKVNPIAFEVKKIRGGFKALNPDRWKGQTPITIAKSLKKPSSKS